MTRRSLVRGLGAGVLGVGGLSACRSRRGGGPTTPPPSAQPLSEPETPLVIAQIGANYGRMASFEPAISVAIDEARIDVNAVWEGIFGQEVVLLERHVMTEPGEDLTEVISGFVAEGATCVITSIDEESLIAAMPALVEAGMAIIDVFTSGTLVRSSEVQTANLLARLAPNDAVLAATLGELALGSTGDDAGPPGTVAFLSEDTAQGRSLLDELGQYLRPRNGKVVSEQFYEVGTFGDVASRVKTVLAAPPSLLVFNGGPEAGPFLSALYAATLDEDERPTMKIPVRLAPAATVDYSLRDEADSILPESLEQTKGLVPGGELTVDHINMMLNRSSGFLETGYAYSQQGYDAFTMACLAAQHALSVEGTALAAAIPAILTGSEECTDFGACKLIMRTALDAQDRATVAYSGRMGALELGPTSDARIGEQREYGYDETNALQTPTPKNFEAPA